MRFAEQNMPPEVEHEEEPEIPAGEGKPGRRKAQRFNRLPIVKVESRRPAWMDDPRWLPRKPPTKTGRPYP